MDKSFLFGFSNKTPLLTLFCLFFVDFDFDCIFEKIKNAGQLFLFGRKKKPFCDFLVGCQQFLEPQLSFTSLTEKKRIKESEIERQAHKEHFFEEKDAL